MSALRLTLLAAVAVLAVSGCGRKASPERPERPDPAVTIPMGSQPGQTGPQDDDPLLDETSEPVTPGPRIEEQADDQLSG